MCAHNSLAERKVKGPGREAGCLPEGHSTAPTDSSRGCTARGDLQMVPETNVSH